MVVVECIEQGGFIKYIVVCYVDQDGVWFYQGEGVVVYQMLCFVRQLVGKDEEVGLVEQFFQWQQFGVDGGCFGFGFVWVGNGIVYILGGYKCEDFLVDIFGVDQFEYFVLQVGVLDLVVVLLVAVLYQGIFFDYVVCVGEQQGCCCIGCCMLG